VPIPADIIQPNRMAPICAEMHIVDGDLYNITQMPDSLYKYSIGHYTAILSKYHTDTVQFKKSFTWYTKNPVKLDKIYDDVLVILQAKLDSINKIKAPTSPVTPPVLPHNVVSPK
jgi:hypothetical protein